MAGFSREELRELMIQHAREDPRVAAVALLGSGARHTEDDWSDIDLAVRLAAGVDRDDALDRWTSWLASMADVSDHLDIDAWGAVYRVFLCANGLQIDLSLWPWDSFRAHNGEAMSVVFGEALDPEPATPQDWMELARMGWLCALHARSAIHRGRTLQADVMLGHWREQVIVLATHRAGLKTHHAREAHLLPDELQAEIAGARPRDLSRPELLAALSRTGAMYLAEVNRHDAGYAAKLSPVVRAIAG